MTSDDRAMLAYVFKWVEAQEARRRDRAEVARLVAAVAVVAGSLSAAVTLVLVWWLR